MKVYISSHDKQYAADAAQDFRNNGCEVVSTWHDETGLAASTYDTRWWQQRLTENLEKIKTADRLVLLSGPDKYPGGKFVEAALAFANGIPVYCVGRAENGLVAGLVTAIVTHHSELCR